MPARAVIGRDEELAAIEAFLADVEQGPTALVLSGEPGIGKTILWEAGVDEADGGYAYVLTCRGVEAEASLSFAGLSELLAPGFDEVADSLLPPRGVSAVRKLKNGLTMRFQMSAAGTE
jgi:hypothetical protein